MALFLSGRREQSAKLAAKAHVGSNPTNASNINKMIEITNLEYLDEIIPIRKFTSIICKMTNTSECSYKLNEELSIVYYYKLDKWFLCENHEILKNVFISGRFITQKK